MGTKFSVGLRSILLLIAWIAVHNQLHLLGALSYLLPATGTATILFTFGRQRWIVAIALPLVASVILSLTTSFVSTGGLPPDTPILNEFRLERAQKDALESGAYSLLLSTITTFVIWYATLEWELWQSRQ